MFLSDPNALIHHCKHTIVIVPYDTQHNGLLFIRSFECVVHQIEDQNFNQILLQSQFARFALRDDSHLFFFGHHVQRRLDFSYSRSQIVQLHFEVILLQHDQVHQLHRQHL
ncbi:hypothetical protein D1872_243320 [compost metagenome]